MRTCMIMYVFGKVHYQMPRRWIQNTCVVFFLFSYLAFFGILFGIVFRATFFHSLGNQAFDPRASSTFFHCVCSPRVWPPGCTGGHICVPLPAQHTRIDGFCLDTAHFKTWKQLTVALQLQQRLLCSAKKSWFFFKQPTLGCFCPTKYVWYRSDRGAMHAEP